MKIMLSFVRYAVKKFLSKKVFVYLTIVSLLLNSVPVLFVSNLYAEEGLNCSNCNTLNKPASKFCINCGTKLENPPAQLEEKNSVEQIQRIICNKCYTGNKKDARFCTNCGNALVQVNSPKKSVDDQKYKLNEAGEYLIRYSNQTFLGMFLMAGAPFIMAAGGYDSAWIGVIVMMVGAGMQIFAPLHINSAGERLKQISVDSRNDCLYLSYNYKFGTNKLSLRPE